MSLTVAVIGMGAVGTLYASKLQQAGASIIAHCRSDYDLVSKNGITITHPDGSTSIFRPDTVVSQIEDITEPVDLICVATKVLPEIDIIPKLKKLSFKGILLLQNGIFIENPIQEAFPDSTLLSGLAFVCVSKTGPGKVHHQDYGGLCIGDYPSGLSALTTEIAALFKKASVYCAVSEEILTDRFKKLCWNAPFNPLSVTEGGLSTEALLAIPGMEQRIWRIMKEVQSIATAAGCIIEDKVLEKHIADTKKMVAYKTSMLLDWERGKALESHAILGNAITFANEKNIPCPEMEILFEKLLAKQKVPE